jgi:hypothetical protein
MSSQDNISGRNGRRRLVTAPVSRTALSWSELAERQQSEIAKREDSPSKGGFHEAATRTMSAVPVEGRRAFGARRRTAPRRSPDSSANERNGAASPSPIGCRKNA